MDESVYTAELNRAIETYYQFAKRRHGLSAFKAGWNARRYGSSLNPYGRELPNCFGLGGIWEDGYTYFKAWEAQQLREGERRTITHLQPYMFINADPHSVAMRAIGYGWKPDWSMTTDERKCAAQEVIRCVILDLRNRHNIPKAQGDLF